MSRITGFILFALFFSAVSDSTVSGQKTATLPRPKNIIIMIGDGVGYNHYAAANYYLGTASQVQERFPVRLAMAHSPAKAGEYTAGNPASNYYVPGYNPAKAWTDTAYLKHNFSESAAAATAMATGVKTYNGSIGMSVDHDSLVNLVQWAKAAGKSAGVVTTVEFAHATPAGFVAHNLWRGNYARIAAEMLIDSRCDVIMGCGNPMYDNNGNPVTGKWNNTKYVVDSGFWSQFVAGSGSRVSFELNGKIKKVQDVDGDRKPDSWTVIHSVDDFRALQSGKTPKRVLGCPEVFETLQQERTGQQGETMDSEPYTTPFNKSVPTLPEMIGGALNVLDNNPKGFFVMIEGGAPDWASHSNQKGRLIEELTGFFDGVNTVIDWVDKNSSWDETLLVVTGDHETGFLWGSQPFIPITDNGKGKLPGMVFFTKEHSNSLVPFFARGAGSELFNNDADEHDSIRGPFIQNTEIAQLIHFLWPNKTKH
jgi:alkaline phosphatase